MTSFDLGFGPMSREIIAALAQWTIERDYPIMLIASRSQVDSALVGGGYVMNTAALGQMVESLKAPKLIMCRDHCGPYLSKGDAGKTLLEAVDRCKTTIESDLRAGFRLIHIDASRCGEHEREVAEELIRFSKASSSLTEWPKEWGELEFEYGSEDNVGVAVSEQKFEQDLKFITGLIQPRYVVGQTGSLVMQARQAGEFDLGQSKRLARLAELYGTKLKEHNADYLEAEEIELRRQAGVHALNIAPQLGVVQTITTAMAASASGLHDEWDDFRDVVIQGGNWKKWEARTVAEQIASGGHYHFNSEQYQVLMSKLKTECDITDAIRKAIWDVVDRYM
jgi:hypothetical protein